MGGSGPSPTERSGSAVSSERSKCIDGGSGSFSVADGVAWMLPAAAVTSGSAGDMVPQTLPVLGDGDALSVPIDHTVGMDWRKKEIRNQDLAGKEV